MPPDPQETPTNPPTYSISKRPIGCGSSKPWAVVNDATKETVPGGCHKTHPEALKHQRALIVNVTKKGESMLAIEEQNLGEVLAGLAVRVLPEYLAYKKAKDLTQKERMQLAKAGLARPDGSYPIRNVAELEDAILAYGRSKPAERESVKAWIKKRAAALRATNKLPADWK